MPQAALLYAIVCATGMLDLFAINSPMPLSS